MEQLLKILPNLSVPVVSILAIIFLVKYLTDRHSEERKQHETVFMNFVESNNHKVTDLVIESTLAIKKNTEFVEIAAQNLKESTEIIKEFHGELLKSRRG